jgi:hypothetical protein
LQVGFGRVAGHPVGQVQRQSHPQGRQALARLALARHVAVGHGLQPQLQATAPVAGGRCAVPALHFSRDDVPAPYLQNTHGSHRLGAGQSDASPYATVGYADGIGEVAEHALFVALGRFAALHRGLVGLATARTEAQAKVAQVVLVTVLVGPGAPVVGQGRGQNAPFGSGNELEAVALVNQASHVVGRFFGGGAFLDYLL